VPIFVFLHVLVMFFAVMAGYGPGLMMLVATRSGNVRALREVTRIGVALAPLTGIAFVLGAALGVVAIFVHGFNPLAGWLVIAYILFAITALIANIFTTPWMKRVLATAETSGDESLSPELAALVNSPRNRAILAIDALVIVALIADMVLKPIPGPVL
jgi:uncharacterized membrane protein